MDRLGRRNSDDRTATPSKSGPSVPGEESPDPSDFEKRLAATPKDRIPRLDPGDRSSVLFIAYEYIEKWFKAQGKNSKERAGCFGRTYFPNGTGAMGEQSPAERSSSRFVLPGKNPDRHADPKLITRGVKRFLPRFLAQGIDAFVPHDLRRTGRTTLGRLGGSPFIGERVINHSKDVLEETYDLWDYFDEKRDALERLESYLLQLRDTQRAGAASKAKQAPRRRRRAPSGTAASRLASADHATR